MKYLLILVDILAAFWVLVSFMLILPASSLFFGSPDPSLFGAWSMVMILSLFANCIPLAWFLYRILRSAWLKKPLVKVSLIVGLSIVYVTLPLLLWLTPVGNFIMFIVVVFAMGAI